MTIVADYIMAQQKRPTDKKTLGDAAGGKGTGGTELMTFLKPLRDNCQNSVLAKPDPAACEDVKESSAQAIKHLLYDKQYTFHTCIHIRLCFDFPKQTNITDLS